jgi:hypothetical protein
MPRTSKDPQRHGISTLLDPSHPFTTPHFQRSYAWRKKQIAEYWDDLKAVLDAQGGPPDYFMGLIVVDENRRIQDGQQRLATTLIFVQELYAIAKELTRSGTPYNESLVDDLTAILAPLNSPSNPVLEVNSPDDQRALLQRVGIGAGLPESTRRLGDARKQLQETLQRDLAPRQINAKLARILAWAQLLQAGAYVVELEVPPQVAHSIFETLNTRGVRLSNGDLVKSFLLARCSNISAGQHLWTQITDSLKDEIGDFETNLDDFLYHFCGSQYTKVSKEQLFNSFSTHVKGDDPLDVLEQLRANAELYAGLIAPFRAPALAPYAESAKYALEFINGLKLRQLRYLLLAVLRDYPVNARTKQARRQRQEELIRKIACWSIRGLVDGRTGGQVAQNVYVAAAAAIRKGEAKSVSAVRDLFVEKNLLIEDDAVFKAAFRTQRFDNVQAKTVLYELERAKLGRSAAIGLKGDLTLEHVLPQRPQPGTWTAFTSDEHGVYMNRLGNYLLLGQPFNSNLGNVEWPEKRKMIEAVKDSQTRLTIAALSFASWNTTTIDRRQAELARAAAAHWAL